VIDVHALHRLARRIAAICGRRRASDGVIEDVDTVAPVA